MEPAVAPELVAAAGTLLPRLLTALLWLETVPARCTVQPLLELPLLLTAWCRPGHRCCAQAAERQLLLTVHLQRKTLRPLEQTRVTNALCWWRHAAASAVPKRTAGCTLGRRASFSW